MTILFNWFRVALRKFNWIIILSQYTTTLNFVKIPKGTFTTLNNDVGVKIFDTSKEELTIACKF